MQIINKYFIPICLRKDGNIYLSIYLPSHPDLSIVYMLFSVSGVAQKLHSLRKRMSLQVNCFHYS